MPEIKFHKSDKFTFFTVDNYFTEKELDIICPEIHSFDNQLSRDGVIGQVMLELKGFLSTIRTFTISSN